MPVHTYGHKHMCRHWAKLGTKSVQIYYLKSSTSNSILALSASINGNIYLRLILKQCLKICLWRGEVKRGFIRTVHLVIKLSMVF